jgi:hypothetical protein
VPSRARLPCVFGVEHRERKGERVWKPLQNVESVIYTDSNGVRYQSPMEFSPIRQSSASSNETQGGSGGESDAPSLWPAGPGVHRGRDREHERQQHLAVGRGHVSLLTDRCGPCLCLRAALSRITRRAVREAEALSSVLCERRRHCPPPSASPERTLKVSKACRRAKRCSATARRISRGK